MWWLKKMWKLGVESFFYSWSQKSCICVCLCTCFKQKHLDSGNVTNLQSQGMRQFIHKRSQGPWDLTHLPIRAVLGGLVGTTSVIIEQLLIILAFYLHCWGETTEWEPPFRKNGSVQGGIACYRSREVQGQLLSDLKIRWTTWEGNDSSLPGGLLKFGL